MFRHRLLLNTFAGLLFGLAAAVLPGTVGFAQTITATINGTVTDQTGAVVPNARVQVTSTATGQGKTATTDGEGRYTVPFLQPGGYKVTVEAQGFAKAVRSGVTLEVAQTAALD